MADQMRQHLGAMIDTVDIDGVLYLMSQVCAERAINDAGWDWIAERLYDFARQIRAEGVKRNMEV